MSRRGRGRSSGVPVAAEPESQTRCSPRKVLRIWKLLSEERKQMVRDSGFGFVEFLTIGSFKSEINRFLRRNFNSNTCTLTISDGKTVRLTENDVRRIYNLPQGPRNVSRFIHRPDSDPVGWGGQLNLPVGKFGYAKVKDVEDMVLSERDDGKWFILFILYVVCSLFQPLSSLSISLEILAIFFMEENPDLTQFNWCEYLVELIREADIGAKVYIAADLYFLTLFVLDRIGGEGDVVPCIRPTVRYWTDETAWQRWESLESLGGIAAGLVLDVEPDNQSVNDGLEKEGTDVGGKNGSGDGGEGCPKEVGPVVSKGRLDAKRASEVVKRRGSLIQTAASGVQSLGDLMNCCALPFTRLSIDHLSVSEAEDRLVWMEDTIGIMRGLVPTLMYMKQQLEDHLRTARQVEGCTQGTEASLEVVNLGSSDDGQKGDKGKETTGEIPDVRSFEHVANIGLEAVSEGFQDKESEKDVAPQKDLEVSPKKGQVSPKKGQRKRNTGPAVPTTEMNLRSKKQKTDSTSVDVASTIPRPKIRIKHQNKQGKTGDKSKDKSKEQGDCGGILTQEILAATNGVEDFECDVFHDSEAPVKVLQYLWREDLDSSEVLYRLQTNTNQLTRGEFRTCADLTELSTVFVDAVSDFYLTAVIANNYVKRWLFSCVVSQMIASAPNDSGPDASIVESAVDSIMSREKYENIDWSGCDKWFFPYCNADTKHFVVYCINTEQRTFDLLDSIGKNEPAQHYFEVGNKIVRYAMDIIHFFRPEWEAAQFGDFKWTYSKGVCQPDKYSCGIFAVNYMQNWNGVVTEEIMRKWCDPDAIFDRRSELCLRLVRSRNNLLREDLMAKALEAYTPDLTIRTPTATQKSG